MFKQFTRGSFRVVFILLLAGSLNASEEGFKPLFDGKSLDGWHKIGGEATFDVVAGEIVGKRGPGKNTFLRTDREYADFILKLEFRWDVLSNSGILFRSHQRAGENGRAYGLQYELDPTDRRWSAGIYDEGRRKWLAPVNQHPYEQSAIKLNDWNQIKLRAQGGRVQTWLNGIQVSDVVDAMDLMGFIALQVHSGEKGQVRFRNIHIKELGEHRWTSEGISDVSAWTVAGKGQLVATTADQITLLGGSTLQSALATDDFAVRMNLPVCEQATEIRFRESQEKRKGPAFGKVVLTSKGARLESTTAGLTSATEILFKESLEQVALTLTVLGDQAQVSVNELNVGRLYRANLSPSGPMTIDFACETATLDKLEWVDFR